MKNLTASGALAVLALTAVVLTGCTTPQTQATEALASAEPETPASAEEATPVAVESAAESAPEEPVAEPEAGAPVDCASNPTASIPNYGHKDGATEVYGKKLHGDIRDSGPSETAQGEPTLSAEGEPEKYVVQTGDTLYGIAERFCIEVNSLGAYNHTFGWDLQVGEVVVLSPDPEVPWNPEG